MFFKVFFILIAASLLSGVVECEGRGHHFRRGFQNRSTNRRSVQNCRVNQSGQYGVCRRFSECPIAQNHFYAFRIPPVYCQYDRSDPVVCCVRALNVSTGQETSPRIPDSNALRTPPPRPSDNIREPRVSHKKCQETYFPAEEEGTFHITVVGGVAAEKGEFLHMAAIGWRKRLGSGYEYSCGGSLISPNFVLTAAHCASIGGAAPEVVRTGGDNLDDASVPDIPIENVIVHPQYRRRQVYNDIALIKLRSSSGHKPACLWTSGGATQQQVQGIGYGHTQFAGRGSKQLMKVILKIFSNQECSRYYTPGSKLESGIINSQVCAGDPNKAMDTCQGDSGGPIVLKANDKGTEIPYVVGITSFGQGCAGGPPSIYTRVTSYLGWIESIVWPSG